MSSIAVSTKKSFLTKHKKEVLAYSLLLFPLIWWGIFFVFAFFRSLYFSFTNLRINISSISSITLENYIKVFNFGGQGFDVKFWKSLGVTGIWTLAMMIGNNVFGLICAYAINNLKKHKKLFLGLLYWPALVSAVVGSDNTKMIFSSSESGFANKVLSWFGCGPIAWFDDPKFALLGLMITPFFLGFSTKLLIYYASIIAIPKDYKEAASLDTDSKVKTFLHVELPLMKNAIVLNVLLSLIDGFKILGPMQLITKGGPNNSTKSIMLYIYELGFERSKMGQACAYSFILFGIILVFTLIHFKLSGKEVDTIE